MQSYQATQRQCYALTAEKKILSILFFFIFLIVTSSNTMAWDAPIGIPTPWIQPDIARPDRPAPWASEQAGYYYINRETGTDSGNTYGVPSNPRATIPSPIPAGSYVEVHGTYNYLQAGMIKIRPEGTATKPVWIVGIEGDEPIFTGGKIFLYGSYCYVDSIKTQLSKFQVGTQSDGYQTDYIMLRNSELWGDGATKVGGIAIAGSSPNHISNVIIYNNHVHDRGDSSATVDLDAHSVTCLQYTNNVWIVDNLIHDGGGAGVALGGTGDSHPYSDSHHLYIARNEIYNVLQSGIGTKMSNNVVISQNKIHDIINTSWSPGKGVGMQYRPHNTWVIYNEIYNTRYGVKTASTFSGEDWNIYVIGNVLHGLNIDVSYDPDNTWAEAAISILGAVNRYIINNTIYNCSAGINVTSIGGTYVVENNIVGDVTNGNQIWSMNKSAIVRNNVTYQNVGDEKIKWGGSSVYNLTDFQTATGKGENSSALAPQFINPSLNNFHLLTTSPAKNTALNPTDLTVDVYALYESTFGKNIRMDSSQILHPQGAAWDIGAFEYNENETSPPPDLMPPPRDFVELRSKINM